MIDSDDLAQMQADLAAMRADNAISIEIRRGSSTLAAQTVRVARTGGRARFASSEGAQESKAQVIVVGAIDLDIEISDRFTVSGVLYEVNFVRPNRTVNTVAEAFAIE